MPVIATLELDRQIAAGEAAREAQRAHGGFGAGVHQTNHLDRRHGLCDQLGQLHLTASGCAETRSCFERLPQRVYYGRRAMAEHQGSPGAYIVDIRIAVDVEYARAFAARDEPRHAAHAAKRAHRGIHAARNTGLRPLKPGFGLRGLHRPVRELSGITRLSRKFISTSCSVPFKFRSRRARSSRYGWVPANRSCISSQKRGLRRMNWIMRAGTELNMNVPRNTRRASVEANSRSSANSPASSAR